MRYLYLIIITSIGFAQDAPKSELKNVTVLPFTQKRDILRYMKKVVVPELGVKCKYCHVMNDYASDEKEAKKVSREMMRMVQGINKNTMQKLGHRDVSCWDCHRGVTPPSKKK
ncbi:MAG: c-type cytochrome [Candidatus Marinimicrobia bacterium]|jgi:hypothetical protein|nr:c-type cytochrome [Candidatus Neomarinimicrobiota bacterium]MDP6789897.1 c-type cytochrome [Candidatus Neomarinimicrobiota bacterium]